MNFLPWKALQVCFQFWNFFLKTQTWFCIYGATESPRARGLACIYMYQWFRSKKLIKNPWINEKDIWFSSHNFPNLFHAFWLQSHPITFDSFLIWLYTKYWSYSMHKKIQNIRFGIFHVFYLIKWIINNKKSK